MRKYHKVLLNVTPDDYDGWKQLAIEDRRHVATYIGIVLQRELKRLLHDANERTAPKD